MNLTKEIEAIRNSPAHGTASMEHLFWKLIDVAQEMVKRMEKLEEAVDDHDGAIMGIVNPDY